MMKTLSIPMGDHSLIRRKAARVAQQAGELERLEFLVNELRDSMQTATLAA